MMQLTSAIAVVVLAITLPLIYLRRPRRNSRGFPYPPGPPGHFIIGNTVDIPKEQRHIAFASWAKRYGSASLRFPLHYSQWLTLVYNKTASSLSKSQVSAPLFSTLSKRLKIFSKKDQEYTLTGHILKWLHCWSRA